VEVVVRAAIIFVFLWFITRVIGKRELSQMNAFEFLLLVVMGDLVQQGVTGEDFSLTAAILAVGTFAVLSVVLSYASWRWPRAGKIVEGAPVVVIRDGEILFDVMKYERLPGDELLEALRQQGIRDVHDVEFGVLEPNGSYSFFTRSGEGGDRRPQQDKAQ
jgi:uncharacterized membrane protein YcaP (DUF421 family)